MSVRICNPINYSPVAESRPDYKSGRTGTSFLPPNAFAFTEKPYLCTMIQTNMHELTLQTMRTLYRPRPADAHKGTMGHALLVAGRHGMAGCALLAAESCLRGGTGKLTVLSHPTNRIILQCGVPEAILAMDVPTDTSAFQSIGIGPGLSPEWERLMWSLMAEGRPLVLDADALNAIAREGRTAGPGGHILTPHRGEMARLSRGLSLPGQSLEEQARSLAAGWHCHVVLKGHPTLILTPEGDVYACPRGNAGMATAGSGDVLTGLITGLLAQGYSAHAAARLGTWLHATAGDLAALRLGQECMLARDITAHLPQAFREIREEEEKTP